MTAVAAILILLVEMHAQHRPTGRPFATRSEAIARNGMAATSQPLATEVALDIMKAGGNAIDAAIAANAVLGLVEPTGSGLGGDLSVIVWEATSRQLHGLNASGRSPMSLTIDEFQRRGLTQIPAHGPLPVTVPGAVDGWFELHAEFGRLSMERILAPAIEYARKGFPVTEVIGEYWRKDVETLEEWPGFAEVYMPNGRAPGKGEVFTNPALASTLEKIASGGRDAFYEGEIAHTIDAFMRRMGGFLSYEDLAAHRSEWVDPVSGDYRGYTVWELPPNSQGIAALQMLNILKGFDIGAMGFGSAEYLHVLTEAKKLAFEDRAKFYADPAFNEIPVEWLISEEYAAQRRALIDMERAAREYPSGDPALETGETVYLTTADHDGNMVSLIQSNYRGMGSGMTPDGLGFVLQDRGELFNLNGGHFNSYEPGKRPFHTIIPGFVTKDGEPYMSFGVMGGAMQPQGHVQILVNIIDFGMNLQEAGDAPRMRHTGSSQPTGEVMTDGGILNLESGFADEVIRVLIARGHVVEHTLGGYGGYQAIGYDMRNAVYFGASESRKDGHAAGY